MNSSFSIESASVLDTNSSSGKLSDEITSIEAGSGTVFLGANNFARRSRSSKCSPLFSFVKVTVRFPELGSY